GRLEIDLRGAGKQEASFLGLTFGVADAKSFEAVYFRPFRFADDDAEARSHAVQYVVWPEYTGEELRKDKPHVLRSRYRARSGSRRVVSRPHRRDEAKSQRLGRWQHAALPGGRSPGASRRRRRLVGGQHPRGLPQCPHPTEIAAAPSIAPPQARDVSSRAVALVTLPVCQADGRVRDPLEPI